MERERVLFRQTTDAVRPAHLVAAAQEVGLRSVIGPPGVEPDRCEVVVTYSGRYPQVPAPTRLQVTFTPECAAAALLQVRLNRWVPGAILVGSIGALALTPLLSLRDGPILGPAFGAFVGAVFVLAAASMTVHQIRSRRRDPGLLLQAWRRAVELAGTIGAERLPAPDVPPAPGLPCWEEKHIRHGWRRYQAMCAGLTRATVEAAFEGAERIDPRLSAWTSHAEDALVIAAHPSNATFEYDPRWSGYLLLPHARMVIRFSAGNAETEIGVSRPYTGVLTALAFLTAGAYVVGQVVHEALASGPGVLLVGVVFLIVGLAPAIGLCWRWSRICREVDLLRQAWARLCAGRLQPGGVCHQL